MAAASDADVWIQRKQGDPPTDELVRQLLAAARSAGRELSITAPTERWIAVRDTTAPSAVEVELLVRRAMNEPPNL